MTERFIAERGSGRQGTAYNTRDWEVLDTERKAGNRVVCRANGKDAHDIAAALNLMHSDLALDAMSALSHFELLLPVTE